MRRVALVAVAALLAGCGSTVQMTGTATTAGTDQLGNPITSAPGAPSTSGLGVPGQVQQNGSLPGQTVPGVGSVATGGPTDVLPSQGPAAAITAPIELGFMTTNVGNAQNMGLNAGQTYSDKQAYEALVKEYNAHGGLNGRKIVPVYGDTDTASSDWSTQFQAACQNLTQDHHVQAVLGYVFVFLDSFEGCLASHRIPHLYGGYQPGDTQAQKDFPSIVSAAHPSVDVSNETVLTGAMATGRLTTKTKLGVIYDGCAHGDRAWKVSTEPWLKAHHISYEADFVACSGGGSDVGPAVAAVKNAELQFAAHGVDRVFIPNAIMLLVFMENAESQAYRPQYINQGGGAAFEANASAIPTAQMRNVHGYGWMPGIDVGQAHQPYKTTPQEAACLGKLKRQGLVPKAYNDFMFAFVTCDALDMYAKALAVTGGRTDGLEVQRALSQVIPTFTGATTYDGAFGVSARERGGPAHYRELGYVDACSCFQYRGPVRTVPGS